MMSTAVLVSVVLAAFATMASVVYALAARIGTRVDLTGQRLDGRAATLERR